MTATAPTSIPRFTTLVDSTGDRAVYDSHTGLYAPFFGDTAIAVAADLNSNLDYPDRYEWTTAL